MKKILLYGIAMAAVLALAVPVFATGNTKMKTDSEKDSYGATTDPTSSQQAGMMERSAEDIKGLDVYSQNGEELGQIEEVAIDVQSGEIRFVTLSRGGILGIGDNEIAVSLEALRFEEDRAILTVDESKLDTAPKQADVADDSQFQRDLQSHYGVSPAWDQDNNQQQDSTSMDMDNKQQDSTSMDQGMQDNKDAELNIDNDKNKKKDY